MWSIFNQFVICPEFTVILRASCIAIHRDIHSYCGKPLPARAPITVTKAFKHFSQYLVDGFAQWQFALSHNGVTDSSQITTQISTPKPLKW